MKFTIAICTLNNSRLLRKCLDSIFNQSYKNYEIIIIDQSDVINSEIKYDKKLIYKHITKKGLSNARNVALSMATGDYFCLMDDDAEYHRELLNIANEYLEKHRLGILCGKIIDIEKNKVALKGMESNNKKKITMMNMLLTCMSPAMIINTELLRQIKFDDDFGLGRHWGSGEETDLVIRFLYKKYKVEYLPQLLVYHPAGDKRNIKLSKSVSYSLGFGALCKKHWKFYQNRTILFLYYKAIFKHIVALIISYMRHDLYMIEYYTENIKGKVCGFNEYGDIK